MEGILAPKGFWRLRSLSLFFFDPKQSLNLLNSRLERDHVALRLLVLQFLESSEQKHTF
jgi:hypothetical protein